MQAYVAQKENGFVAAKKQLQQAADQRVAAAETKADKKADARLRNQTAALQHDAHKAKVENAILMAELGHDEATRYLREIDRLENTILQQQRQLDKYARQLESQKQTLDNCRAQDKKTINRYQKAVGDMKKLITDTLGPEAAILFKHIN